MLSADRYLSGHLRDKTTSGPLQSEPPRRRRLWLAATGLSILIIALVVFALQPEGDGESDGPLNAVADAAERTQGEPGGHATMLAIVSTPSRPDPLTIIKGQMVFDDETAHSKAILTVSRPGSDGSVKMDVVTDETSPTLYMRSSMFGSLPGGREWMALDLSSFGPEQDTPLPANADAKGELELLQAATGVRKLGKEEVRGVPTTHYRGTLDPSGNAEWLRKEGASDLASRIEQGTPPRLEAWIDADGLVRRMRLVNTQPREGGEGPVTTDMRMDFFDFGAVPEIDLPESSEVFDATTLAEDGLGLSNDD